MAKAVAKSKKIAAKSKPSAPARKAAPRAAARPAMKKTPPKQPPKAVAKVAGKAPLKPAVKPPSRSAAKMPAAKPATSAVKAGKWVYTFGDGKAEGQATLRDLLGGKGANLAEMANLGLPVPPASPFRPRSARISTSTTRAIRRN